MRDKREMHPGLQPFTPSQLAMETTCDDIDELLTARVHKDMPSNIISDDLL